MVMLVATHANETLDFIKYIFMPPTAILHVRELTPNQKRKRGSAFHLIFHLSQFNCCVSVVA